MNTEEQLWEDIIECSNEKDLDYNSDEGSNKGDYI
jgi:hypothetical protein